MTSVSLVSNAQIKILFDDLKAETSGNTADWTVDCPVANQDLCWPSSGGGYTGTSCYHSGPLQIPTPAQSGITASTPETYWTGALSNWGVDLVKLGYGYVIETLPYNGSITYGNSSNPQDLSNYKVFIVDEPNIRFTTAEKTALVNFVYNGGGLYMISDHNGSDRNNDGWDSPHIWMDFAATTNNPFGFIVDTVTISPTVNTLPNLPNDSCLHGPMGTVTGVKWHSGTSFTLYPSVNPTVVGVAYNSGTSGNTGVLAGHARYGRGKVAFLGDSSPTDDGTGNTANPSISLTNSYTADMSGSHQKLLVNTTVWLASVDSPAGGGGTLTLTSSGSTICAGQSVTLTAAGASSYQWSPGGNTTAAITVSPTTTSTYTVTGMVNGSAQTQTITVTVNNKPTPQFSTSLTGTAVTVTNTSTNATSYVWHFGDGSAQITGSSPAAHTYTTAGTYTIMLITTNGCGSDTITHNVIVSTLSLSPSGTTSVCQGQSTTLTASGASSYQWSPGGNTTASITVSPTTNTTYTVTGMVNGVAQTQSVTVTVNHKPTPGFSTSLAGMLLSVTNTSTNATTYAWSFGDGSATVTGGSPSPHTYAANGSYTVMLITTNGCGTDTVTHSITLNGLSLSPNGVTTVCKGQPITLTASGATSYQWSPGGNTTASVTVSPTTATTYTVTGMINGAPQTQTVTVNIDNVPVASFTASAAGRIVTVNDQTTNGTTYSWLFGDGTPSVSGINPSAHTYNANGTYTITLIATNSCGPDTTTQQVTIHVTGVENIMLDAARIYQINANEIKITYPIENLDRNILIYNTSGQIVMVKIAENYQAEEIVDLSSLATGLYIVRAGNSVKRFIR